MSYGVISIICPKCKGECGRKFMAKILMVKCDCYPPPERGKPLREQSAEKVTNKGE